jgi:hypothetical protein
MNVAPIHEPVSTPHDEERRVHQGYLTVNLFLPGNRVATRDNTFDFCKRRFSE